MAAHWYVAYVRSRSEKKVAERLEKNGITCYLPLIKSARQWSDRKKIVSIPMFSGYIFVHCLEEQLTNVRMVSGVANFIYREGKPARMPESDISTIKSLLNAEFYTEVHPDSFAIGTQVKINFGPMAGTIGELVAIENEKLFLLRIDVIQQALLIKVPAAYLEKI